MLINDKKIIEPGLLVSAIVSNNYRTADVFRKYDIDFCCGGKWPLQLVCEIKKLDLSMIQTELKEADRIVYLPASLEFENWNIDFLTEYIVNVHHQYLKKAFPIASDYLVHFAEGHQKKYPYLAELLEIFEGLKKELLPQLIQEEDILFPYIRQIARAYYSKESYAGLLVRTLRKPEENVMRHKHDMVNKFIQGMRQLTGHYVVPENACVNHKVTFSKLSEIDNDLVQHMHLENNFLFPKAIAMENELLLRKD